MLSRPEKHNAMTLAMVAAGGAGVRELDADPEIEVILLEAEGDHFSSGGDLAEYKGVPIDHAGGLAACCRPARPVHLHRRGAATVVVAKVQGLAHAGGLLLSLCADLTVAVDRRPLPRSGDARRPARPVHPARLIAKVGLERASWLMLTAREIDGTEAERIGLVARCVEPSDRLDAEVKETLDAILATDQASRAAWKPVLRREVMPFDARIAWSAFFTSHATADAGQARYVRPEE